MLPPAFLERLARVIPGDHHARVLASFGVAKPPCLWPNPLRAAPADTLDELARHLPGARLEPTLAGAVVVHDCDPALVSRLPLVADGRGYLINPSSLVPPAVLAPEPDDAVLDLCAAPGGKTLQLAARLAAAPGAGHLAAVEAVKPRFFKLRAILERHGALARVRLFLKDGRAVGGAVPERFDKVLLDAPCSSEARFDPDDPATTAHWSPRKIAECAHKQKGLLRSALAALKPGGTLVYSTCSFAPEENEAVVLEVLAEHPGRVVPMPAPLPALPHGAIPGTPGLMGLDAAWRILPDAVWDGFFLCKIAKLEKR